MSSGFRGPGLSDMGGKFKQSLLLDPVADPEMGVGGGGMTAYDKPPPVTETGKENRKSMLYKGEIQYRQRGYLWG